MTNCSIYFQKLNTVSTEERSLVDITYLLRSAVQNSGVTTGLCHVFIQHTSASLIISENADPDVLVDLETFMAKLVPDGDPMFIHTSEGDDDMPAHVRSILTQTEISVPISTGRLVLGTWQGVYLWEHRQLGSNRKIMLTVHGV